MRREGNSKTSNVHVISITCTAVVIELLYSEQLRQPIAVPDQEFGAAVDVSSDAEVEQTVVVERRFHVLLAGTAGRQHVRHPLGQMFARRVAVHIQLNT